jgi:protein involved in polysaccharide export with SLBB domain
MIYEKPRQTGRAGVLPRVGVGLAAMLWLCQAAASELPSAAPQVLSSDATNYLSRLMAQRPWSTNIVGVLSNAIGGLDSPKPLTVDALDDTHRLGTADKVTFRILEDRMFDDKEESKELYVTDSGELDIPYLGRIPAVSKTCKQLAEEIKRLLEEKYYYKATVLVGVDILNKTRGRVYISGKVKVPGYLDIPSDEVFTVSKAILRAGGFTEFADKRHVRVTRGRGNSAGLGDIVVIDVGQVLEKGLAGKDLELGPDDRVFVPSKLVSL